MKFNDLDIPTGLFTNGTGKRQLDMYRDLQTQSFVFRSTSPLTTPNAHHRSAEDAEGGKTPLQAFA